MDDKLAILQELQKTELNQYFYVRTNLTDVINKINEDPEQQVYKENLSELRKIDISYIDESRIFYVTDKNYIRKFVDNQMDLEFLGFTYDEDNIFRERYIIPIYDYDYIAIGMCGYDNMSNIKYMFARTEFFDKTKILYNKQNIDYSNKFIIIVEGFFDSIRLNSIGFKNNCALMGARLYKYQKTIIERFKYCILIPDNDQTGISELKNWMNIGVPKAVIYLPEGIKDIDEYFKRAMENDLYNKAVQDFKNVVSKVEFRLEHKLKGKLDSVYYLK